MTETAPRILFATGALSIYPLRTAFALARAAGCDGVELDVCPESICRGPGAIARLAAETGLAVGAVHPPLFALPGWRRERDMLPRLVDLALALQAPIIVVHPPKATRLGSRRVAEFGAHLVQARRRLEGTGTQITLENPGFFGRGYERYPLWHLPALCRFAEQCGLGITLDTTHAGSSPYPLPDSYAMVRGRLAHIHLSDLRTPPRWLDRSWLYSYVKHHQMPGAGSLPLPQLLRSLADDGFRGDIALELSPVGLQIWSLARAQPNLARAVQATRRLLAGELSSASLAGPYPE